ncbi:MAG: acyl-ACP--UDP-N-acetylglucosamine O-acyltransferase [Verrucomicrobia bacterium]|nr:acyl-ACP--UDP-N-acetylglucosamine O-acyltransferase [Verrucomicrobiota bacterium]
MAIHSTAVIEEGARIGKDVEIGPFVFIDRAVELGDGCRVGPHAVIFHDTRIGANCRIHAGAVLGDDPQDVAYGGGQTYLQIGDNCIIRECVTIHRGTVEGSSTIIGNGCLFMACSHAAHNVKMGNRVILANGVLLAGHVEVGDGVFMSGNVGVHQFCRIGRLAMLGGNGSISKDVPPFCMTRTGGYNQIGGLNVVGLRRAGFDPEVRKQIKGACELLYHSGLNVTQAVEKMKELGLEGPAAEFISFIESSKRGICSAG